MRPRLLFALPACLVSLGCSLSSDREAAIGEQDAAQINAQLPLISDPQILQFVDDLGQSIAAKTSRSDLTWHFYVVNTKDVNAFALPGGYIYVNRGLIEQATKLDQLAGAIGHEIGHVVRRHAVAQMNKEAGANIGVSLACTLTRICENSAARVAINVAGSALFAKYSRQDEAEADSEAVMNVARAGYDPRGIPELFELLIRERQRAPSELEGFFASHPLEESRIAAARAQIATYTPLQLDVLTADNIDFQSFKRAITSLPAPPPPKQPATQP